MKFKQNFVDALASTSPTVLAEICNLKFKITKGGVDAFSYLNPEKTPSLKINVKDGVTVYKDFSSGEKGGNAIDLYLKVYGMSFVEGIKDMAQRTGTPIEYEDGEAPKPGQVSKNKLYTAMEWSSDKYSENLSLGLEYLKSRGISAEHAKKWGLGFAKDEWQLLANMLDDSQCSVAESVGLISKSNKNGKYYDFFHDRLIFPITQGSQTIALAGRLMDGEGAKYINTKNSPIYNKSKALYGFDNASRLRTHYCFVMEGYMDVIATDTVQLPAVATCGTALTEEHLTKLYSHFDELIFCFDGDAAGVKAKQRAIDMVLPHIKNGKSASFITLPGDKDPADCIQDNNLAVFEQKESLSEAITNGVESLSEAEQMKFLTDFSEKMNKLEDSLQRLLLIHRVANKLNVNEEAMKSLLN